MVRITVILPPELGEKVLATAKEQKRSKSAMLTIMAEDWYKLPIRLPLMLPDEPIAKTWNFPACDHDFVAIEYGTLGGNYRCTKCGARI